MTQDPLVIERTFNAPIENVWRAITDNEQMKQWYFQIKDFKPEVGFEFQFEAGSEDKTYLHICKVTEVIVGKKLTYSWHYDKVEGMSFVTFELFDENGKTRVKLTHKGLETFPVGDPAFAKKSFAEGWTQILGKSLKEFLEKVPVKS